MPGIGTIVNVIAVILGGIAGLVFGKKIKSDIRDSLMKAAGVAVIFIGISGALSGLLKITPQGTLSTDKALMMIISLIVGTLLGELIKIEDKLDRFGEWLKIKARATEDGGFVGAFVNTSLIICVGAMAVVHAPGLPPLPSRRLASLPAVHTACRRGAVGTSCRSWLRGCLP